MEASQADKMFEAILAASALPHRHYGKRAVRKDAPGCQAVGHANRFQQRLGVQVFEIEKTR
jgi:hypothetical protein